MRQLFLAFFITMLGSSILAQPMLVRSGEHDGFTRIVIDAGPNAEWTAKYSGDLVELSVDGPKKSFDLAQVYSRITQDRIKSVKRSGDTILLQLACKCSVSVFDSPPGMIVTDIASEGIELTTPLIETVLVVSKEVAPTEEKDFTKIPSIENNILDGLSQRSESTTIFQAAITHDIGSLGTQGILKKNKPVGYLHELNALPPPAISLNRHSLSEFRNVKIGTPIKEKLAVNTNAGTTECRESRVLDVIGEAIISGDFTKYREYSSVIDPQLQEQTTTILDLLHNGLGAEAGQILEYYEGEDTEISFLKMISGLLEYGHSDNSAQLSSMLACTPSLKIWALATYNGDGTDLKEEDVKDSLLSFSEFPRHLRNIIHPLLEKTMKGMKFDTSKGSSPRSANQTFPDLLNSLSMNAKKVDYSDIFANDLAIKEDSTPSVGSSTKSLALAMENTIENGETATIHDMKIIDMEAFEAAGTEDEGRLKELKLSALLSRGEFYNAYDVLARQNREEHITVERMANKMFGSLVTDAPDIEFLELTMPIEETFKDLLDTPLITKIEDRQNSIMISIGNAGALGITKVNGDGTPDQERNLTSPAPEVAQYVELASQQPTANIGTNLPSPEETLNLGEKFRDSLDNLIR